MRTIALAAAAALVVMPLSAMAQQRDPYRSAEIEVYKRQRTEMLDRVSGIYGAAACKVVPNMLDVTRLSMSILQGFAQSSLPAGVTDPALQQDYQAAMHRGVDLIKQHPDACDYWRDHPEEVVAFRRMVAAAAYAPSW